MGRKHEHIMWQSGGGACSKCGAPGVTITTCPFNPAAKNPKPGAHNPAPKAGKKTTKLSPIISNWDILPIAAATNNISAVKKANGDFYKFIIDYSEGPMSGVGEGDWSDFVDSVMSAYDDAISNTTNKAIKTFLKKTKEDISEEIMYPY